MPPLCPRVSILPLPLSNAMRQPGFGQNRKSQSVSDARFVTTVEGRQGTHLYNHSSYFLRDPDCWIHLTHLLAQNFPKGVAIEVYGAAQGQEALALAACIQAKMGQKSPLFPLEVSDIEPRNLLRGRLGLVNSMVFEPLEQDGKALTTQQDFQYLWQEVLTKLKVLGPSWDEMFVPNPVSNLPLHLQTDKSAPLNPDWQKALETEQIFQLKPRFLETLLNRLSFNPTSVDAVAALSQPKETPRMPRVFQLKDPRYHAHPKLFPQAHGQPRVVVLRNFVYLIPKAQRNQLLMALERNMPVGSLLVMGHSEMDVSYDKTPGFFNMDAFDPEAFKTRLHQAGFEPTHPFIWRKKT